MLSHFPTTAGRSITGPSTVGCVGSSCLARVMLAEAGIIIGRISEISGNSELIMGELGYVHSGQKEMRGSIKSKVTKRCRCLVKSSVTWAAKDEGIPSGR